METANHHGGMRPTLRVLLACLVALVCALAHRPALAEEEIALTEGDVIEGFAAVDTDCSSSDPSVAWVDGDGSLNALKVGTTVVTANDQEYAVTVEDYQDGSAVVGNLRILARYNDKMMPFDGHVYLLFTSYQDGVQINVADAYAAYEISGQYYEDIRQDIANGSNHTGTDAEAYFSYSDSNTFTLNRGQIVTVGMYRDFNLSIAETALGAVRNSTLWTSLSDAAKTDIVNIVFSAADDTSSSQEDLFAQVKAVAEREGVDYTQLIDGVVDGGVCLNRELYNQKLEWDQYENVAYDMDITQNQLDALLGTLNGNNGRFSLFFNSCATVALRAWNAAVGTRDGADTAYTLSLNGRGIYALADTPKSVRDAIVDRLPGYCLNNSEGVDTPDASFVDDTGYVYVSAPVPVSPVAYTYADESLHIDESRSDLQTLFGVARAGSALSYGADPAVVVDVPVVQQGDLDVVDHVDFTLDGQAVSLNQDTWPADGVWLKLAIDNPKEDVHYYVADANGNALPSEYAEGTISFLATTAPCAFRVVEAEQSVPSRLTTTIVTDDMPLQATTEVYYYGADGKVTLGADDVVPSGSTVYVSSKLDGTELNYVLSDVIFDGDSIMGAYDAEEGAYAAVMPKKYAKLRIVYEYARVSACSPNPLDMLQVSVGDELSIDGYASLWVGDEEVGSDELVWDIVQDEGGILSPADESGQSLKANATGTAIIWAHARSNKNIGVPYMVEVYQDTASMAKVEYGEGAFELVAKLGEDEWVIPYSGYLVEQGTTLTVVPTQNDGSVISSVWLNNKYVSRGKDLVVNRDSKVRVTFTKASITGVPSSIRLAAKGDSQTLDASVKYDGVVGVLPAYDSTIRFESADPLVAVDETGTVTVVGDVPEGGQAVIVMTYAGSSNDSVSAQCKVIVGDYQGERVVGRMTIYARRIAKGSLVPHASLVFTTYEDTDVNASYYRYYQPTEAYMGLMADYRDNPHNYASDPALYSDNQLGLENREAYFTIVEGSAGSEPQPISLQCGESMSMSSFSYDESNLMAIARALEEGSLANSEDVQELAAQMRAFYAGEEIDGPLAYDALVSTLVQMYLQSRVVGHNPIDGPSEGGRVINKEFYNQFLPNNQQTPNSFYTVEITADELACLRQQISSPDKNYYSVFDQNCALGVASLWNATLADRPELQLDSSITGLVPNPESLYFDIERLGIQTCKEYEPGVQGKEEGFGRDFYPRTVRCAKEDPGDEPGEEPKTAAQVVTAPKALELTYAKSSLVLVEAGEASGGTMVYSLDNKTFVEQLPRGINAGAYTVYYKVVGDERHEDSEVASVRATIAKAAITPTATILGWVYGANANKPQVRGNAGGGAVTYAYAKKGSTAYAVSVPTEAGSYTVRATIAETANYLGGTATADFSVAKAPIVPTVSIEGWTYGTTANKPAVSSNLGGVKVTYAYAKVGEDQFSSKVPKDVGSYMVRATVAASTNYLGGTALALFRISRAPIAPKVTIKGWTYGATANKPTVSGNPGGAKVTYAYAKAGSDKFSSTVPKDAGSYVVRATVAASANYLGGTAKASFKIAQAPAPTLTSAQKATAVAGLIADGIKQALVAAPKKLPAGYTKVRYSVDGGKTWTDAVPTGKAAGAYTVRVKYVGDANHKSFEASPIKVKVSKHASATVTAHVQKKGWVASAGAGKPAGSMGESLRMEAIKISLVDASETGGIEYRSHVQTYGWETSWARDGKMSGTEGQSKRLEAIQIRLYGNMAKAYDVYYRVHAQHYGWMGWAKNGQQAGTAGMSYRLEALQVVLVKKGAPAPGKTYQGITQTTDAPFAKK